MTKQKFQEPVSLEEWQHVADLAHTYLCLYSARQYGLITGGPHVNIERCKTLLLAASDHGIEPHDDAVMQCMPGILLETESV